MKKTRQRSDKSETTWDFIIVHTSVQGISHCVFVSGRSRHTRLTCDWSSDVCSSDLLNALEARLVSANAGVREAEANLAKANDDVQRYKLLVEKDEISRQQYDTAVDA